MRKTLDSRGSERDQESVGGGERNLPVDRELSSTTAKSRKREECGWMLEARESRRGTGKDSRSNPEVFTGSCTLTRSELIVTWALLMISCCRIRSWWGMDEHNNARIATA